MDKNYILTAPESLKYITDNMEKILNNKIVQYKKLFGINNLEKIKINYFDDIEKFKKFIYELRGKKESLPEYCVATFDNDMINAYIEKGILLNSIKYQRKLFLANHELFHILYKKYILKNDMSKRIVWYDEGMALFLSGENDNLLDIEKFKNFYLRVKSETLEIPNINKIQHGKEFFNEKYNGYDLSYLCVRYLNEILSDEEFKKLMSNFEKIKEYGESIINDMFSYYDNNLIYVNKK